MNSATISPEVRAPQGAASTRVRRVSFEEFLAWPEEGGVEWVDGEIIPMAPASLEHQIVDGFLYKILSEFVEQKSLGIVLSNPFLMRLSSRPSGREPDVLYVAEENRHRLTPTYLDGPADLLVEIISPESRKRDTETKRGEYEAGGVREYWLLDPENRRAEFLFLGDDGKYRALPVEDGVFHSRVLAGLWLREEWLWQTPKLRDVLREWDLL